MSIQVISDIMAGVVARVSVETQKLDPGFAVQFELGHYREVEKSLVLKSQSQSQFNKAFPLIWLVMDFEERRGRSLSVYADVSLDLIIATSTAPEWSITQRIEKSFKPKLYPVYAELLKQISKTPAFFQPPIVKLIHSKTDRPYWGVSNGESSEANFFSSFVDAIQIQELSLQINKTCIK